MDVLSNIPNAILNNIGFMAILFMVYECVKWMGNLKPAKLFLFAGAIQVISLLQFISSIFAAHTFSLIEMTAKIANVTIPLNNNNNIQWLTLIGFTYCIILIYFLVRILFQFKYIAGLKKSANFTQSDFLTSSLPTHILKNTANIKIGFSDQIDAPITFGWLTPIVLLPIAICNQLTTKEMETILIHEIAHILRKDYLVNIIISLNQTILFFNPFSILLNKEMSLQREIACDLIVIKNNPKKVEYMNALLKIAEHVNNHISNSASLTMGILGSQSELLKRIQYFNNVSIHSSKQLIIKLSMGAVLGSFIFISTGPTTITNNNTPIAINANYIKKNNNLAVAFTNKKATKVLKQSHIIKGIKGKHSHDLKNETYASLVDQTLLWIKKHEPATKLATYQEELDNDSYKIADKLLIRAIFSNYQLKRDLLNQKLAKASNLKEALDYLLKSEELEQIKQYEKWTKEFLQTHPQNIDTTLLEEPIIY
jgi:beta-lactamase regulating signal transducer with metallopeptidase domain